MISINIVVYSEMNPLNIGRKYIDNNDISY